MINKEDLGKDILAKKLFKVGKFTFENYKSTIMVDLFDLEYNRLYIHIHANGEMMFEVFYLNDRLYGKTTTPTSEIKNIYDVIKEVKENLGVDIIYTAELQ